MDNAEQLCPGSRACLIKPSFASLQSECHVRQYFHPFYNFDVGLVLGPMYYAPDEAKGIQYIPSMAVGSVLLLRQIIMYVCWTLAHAMGRRVCPGVVILSVCREHPGLQVMSAEHLMCLLCLRM